MLEKSKKNEGIETAIIKGYKSNEEGKILNILGNQLKTYIKKRNYHFSLRLLDGSTVAIPVHRFIAYEKFGDEIFKKDVIVKHKDLDPLNNKPENIILGNSSEANTTCKSEQSRRNSAITASSHTKKHNHEDIIKMHSEGMSYNKIMELTGIKSKGTISFIIKQSISSVINETK